MDLAATAHAASGVNWTGIAAVIAPITTLLGVLGGYWLAGRNEESRDKRADSRERAAWRAALAERLEEDRHTFQRDTLLALQDELLALIRSTTGSLSHYEQQVRDSGRLEDLPDNLGGEEAAEISASVQRSRTRLLDDHLRSEIATFTMACAVAGLGVPSTPRDALKRLSEQQARLSQMYVPLAELVGEHLRRELDRRILVTELDADAPGE